MIGMVRSDSAVQAEAPQRAAWLTPGATVGVGSLPHRNARQAAEFVLAAYDVPTMPSLPRRSPAESPIAQALVGVCGVTLGQYGTVAIDVGRLDASAPVCTDLERDHFTGFRTFLAVARELGHSGPVAWHLAGPISVGVALLRAGAAPDLAFEVSRGQGPRARRGRGGRRRTPGRAAAGSDRRAVRRRGVRTRFADHT
jgi:hypothetical protein